LQVIKNGFPQPPPLQMREIVQQSRHYIIAAAASSSEMENIFQRKATPCLSFVAAFYIIGTNHFANNKLNEIMNGKSCRLLS